MPVFEGIGLINEKNPVVLEVGKALTKAGFAGEPTPRCIIPSEVQTKDPEDPTKLVRRRLRDFKDEADLYQLLVDFLHHLYCRHLLVTPKDRKVVVVESVLTTNLWRQTLAKVLYLHYEVLIVLWVPSSVAAAVPTCEDTALVVDFGFDEVQITPLFRGVTVLSSIICHELGAAALNKNLSSLLASNCLNKPKEEVEQLLTSEKVEDIRVRCCVVTSMARAALLKDESHRNSEKFKPFTYEVDGQNILQFHGSVREKATEIWFNNSEMDGISLPLMILQALSTCPVDTRKPLASKILIVGGTSMLPGLRGRLLSELKTLVNSENELEDPVLRDKFVGGNYEFLIYDVPVKENCANWLGGALYGATEAMTLRGVTKEVFLKQGAIPDWSELQFETRSTVGVWPSLGRG